MDFTPFIRKQREEPLLMDESVLEAQRLEKAERIQAFRLIRDTILEHREQERVSREVLKRRHMDLYEGLQVALDEQRRRIIQVRDAYWAQLLEAELTRDGVGSGLDTHREAELGKTTPQSGRRSAGKKPKSAGKKK